MTNNMQAKYISIIVILVTAISQGFGQVPVISNIEPDRGYPGEVISIKGDNFSAGARVFFGAAEGDVLSISAQLIEVRAPLSATFDYISVLNTIGQTGYSSQKFLLSYGGDSGIASSSFSSQQDFAAESGLYDVCLCDLDGDGLTELIAANSNSANATVYLNSSTPGTVNFSTKTNLTLPSGNRSLNVTCGDLTGDGLAEIVFSDSDDGSELFVYNNYSVPGSLSFTRTIVNINGFSTKRVSINDMDADGRPDLVVSDQSQGRLAVIANATSGSDFMKGSEVVLPVVNSSSTSAVVLADINNDGKVDIATSQFVTNGGGFYVMLNQSTPSNFQFAESIQFPVTGTLVNLLAADMNNDGFIDLIATRFLTDDIAIYINTTPAAGGSPTFADPVAFAANDEPWGLDIGDFDGDGDGDIVVNNTGDDKAVTVLENTSSGSLSFNRLVLPVNYINRNVRAGDVNDDGRPDIVYTSIDDNNNGIPASQISILINENCITPVIDPAGPLTYCAGNEQLLYSQKIPGATYDWIVDGAVVKSSSDNFIVPTTTGQYTVELSEGSCTRASNSVSITIQGASSLSPVAINPVDEACTGETVTLSIASDVGATLYEWRGPDGFSATGTTTTINDFNTAKAGKYYVDVYDGTCLAQTAEIIVDIITVPSFSVNRSGNGTYCEGETVTLSVLPAATGFSYRWFDQIGAISGATTSTYQPSLSGNYYAQITDNINTTCPVITSNSVDIAFYSPPVASFSNSGDTCAGGEVTFTNTSTVSTGANVKYAWDFGDGRTSSQPNPGIIFNNSGSFTITLTVSYEGISGCSSTTSQTININSNISPVIVAENTALCEGETLTLSLDQDYVSYAWSTGDTGATLVVSEAGNYSVAVVDAIGCEGSVAVAISERPSPQVFISADQNDVAPGTPVQLTATGLESYSWSPADVLDNNTIANPVATVIATTTFTVFGADTYGCAGEAAFTLNVSFENLGSLLEPKKYFTPNGDEFNNVWLIDNMEQFPQCGVDIYDQAGNLIYNAKPYLNDWDGTSKGKQLPAGVYYYIINCDDIGNVKSGSITLLR